MALLVIGTDDFVDSTEDEVRAVVADAAVAERNPTQALDAVVVVVDSVAADVLLFPTCALSNCPETVDDVESFTDNLPRLSASLFAVDDTGCAGVDDDGTVPEYVWVPRGYPSGPEL